MLELLSNDVNIGAEFKLYLISGITIECVLKEIGPNYIIVSENGTEKRFFEAMIGGWDVTPVKSGEIKHTAQESNNQNSSLDKEVEKRSEADLVASTDSPSSSLANNLLNKLIKAERSTYFESNAVIVSADNHNILIRTLANDASYYVSYKFVATNELRAKIQDVFLSGNDSHETTLPIHVGFYYKDKQPVSPNIILEPGTLDDYCSILTHLTHDSALSYLAKNLLFCIWKSFRTKISKSLAKELQASLKGNTDNITIKRSEEIKRIDEQIKSNETQGLDILPYLTKKAQLLSSQNKYQDSIDVYNLIIEKLDIDDESNFPAICHNYITIASLQSKLKLKDEAISSLETALHFNPDNNLATNMLKKLSTKDSIDDVEIYDTPSLIKQITEYTDSVMKEDVDSYKFTDPEILSNNGMVTSIIADRLLEQAEKDGALSSYLEASKAYNYLKVEDEDTALNYAKAFYGYASIKSRMIFNTIASNPLSAGAVQQRRIDSSYCYFVSAINFGSIIGHGWAAHLRDYVRLRVFGYSNNFPKFYQNVLFEQPFDEFISTHNLTRNEAFIKECSNILISIGGRCPIIKDNLSSDSSKTIATIMKLIDNVSNKSELCKNLCHDNRCSHIKYTRNAAHMISDFIDYRIKKISLLYTRINVIKAKAVDSLFEESTLAAFKRLKKAAYFLTPLDYELGVDAEILMKSLVDFKSRSTDERRVLAPGLRTKLEDSLKNSSEYASYLNSDVLKDTWTRILQSKYLSMKEASSSFKSELVVNSDGAISNDSNGRKTIPLSIYNEGLSTVDIFRLSVRFSESDEKPNSYEGRSLAPHESAPIVIHIPNDIQDHILFDYSVEIKGSILGTWSSEQIFNLTASYSAVVDFQRNDIKWDYQAKETRVDMFKGRQGDIDRLIQTFTSDERRKIPIVFGLTRTGKSSILINLKKRLLEIGSTLIKGEEFTIAPIYIDISSINSLFHDHESFMVQLSLLCEDQFKDAGVDFGNKDWSSLKEIINDANNRKVYPLIMFDEFSYISKVLKFEGREFLKNNRDQAIEEQVGFIYAGTYDILDIIRDPEVNPSGTFMNIEEYKIYNFKDPKEAEALMDVMEPKLVFTNAAKIAIHDYSGDVPYWIQMICKHCALYAINCNHPVIGTKELDDVIDGLLGKAGVPGVGKLSDEIFLQQQILPSDPKETKALLFSIAFLMKDKANRSGVSWTRLKEFWNENNYKPDMESIVRAKERLEDRLSLLSEEIDGNMTYRFSVGLFRKWCSGKDVISEFDKTNTVQ